MSSLPLVRPHLFVPAALALIALFVLAAAHDASSGVAQAQTPPPYDAFNDRERWYHDCCSGGPDLFPLDRTYSSAGATLEPGESAPCAAIGATIWIEYIPDRSGRLSLDVSGSDFDVVVAA